MEMRLKKKGFTKWAILGLVLALLGLGMVTLDPVGKYVKASMTLKEGTMIWGMFQQFPVEILMKIYLFNITNAEAFMKGTDKKLELQEIGPYVYKETRKNLNLTMNDNGTVSYVPANDVVYMPDRSVGNVTEDILYTANIPLLGAYAMYKDSATVNFGLNVITSSLKSQSILNLTVYDFLWGYEDKMITMASKYMSNWIPFSKFGIMDRMYEDQKNQSVTMDVNETSPELYTIQRWNGAPGLIPWNLTAGDSRPCSLIKGSFEGLLFPPNMKGRQIRVFKKSFCRPMRLNYVDEVMMDTGLLGHVYEMANAELGCTDPYNECYCIKEDPLPEGFSDLSPCNYDLPLALSFPHFYQVPTFDELSEKIGGLNASYEKHSSKIILQPTIGMPMEITTKNQLNIVLPRLRYNKKVKIFSNMVVPVLWMDHCVEGLPDWLTQIVLFGNKYLPVVQLVLGWFMVVVGSILFFYMIFQMTRSPKNDKDNIKHISEYAPVAMDALELTKDNGNVKKVEIIKMSEKTIN